MKSTSTKIYPIPIYCNYSFPDCELPYSLVKFIFVKTAISYLKDVRLELTKVVWPKRNEVIKLTIIVMAISGIVGAYVGGLDYVFTKILSLFIGY